MLCVVFLLAPGIPAGIALILSAIGNRLLNARRIRVTGARVSEFRGGAWVYTVVLGVAMLVTLGLGMFLVFQQHITWVAWVVGVLIFVITVAHGWLIERASRAAVES